MHGAWLRQKRMTKGAKMIKINNEKPELTTMSIWSSASDIAYIETWPTSCSLPQVSTTTCQHSSVCVGSQTLQYYCNAMHPWECCSNFAKCRKVLTIHRLLNCCWSIIIFCSPFASEIELLVNVMLEINIKNVFVSNISQIRVQSGQKNAFIDYPGSWKIC